jgi:hypothetical protein
MSSGHSAELHPDEKLKIGKYGQKLFRVGLGVGIVMLLVGVGIGFAKDDSMSRFFHSYLIGFTYFLGISLGALFFVILQHLVRAEWSVVVRRLAELLTMTFPLMLLLSLGIVIPLLVGYQHLYLWTVDPVELQKMTSDPTTMVSYHLIHVKEPYLNSPFFAARIIFYCVAGWGIATWFFRKSVAQDGGEAQENTEKMRVVSAPAMIAFAFITAFASFDLLMSLDPHWFSTIFGVYYFAGNTIMIMGGLALLAMMLQRAGKLEHSITVEHYHDLGKLMFAFVFFWSYISFSQFMLIWYGNIPEETAWYYQRMFTDFKPVSYLLLFGHCVFPFLCLLSRETKRRLKLFAFFIVWMTIMHFVDLWWLVVPEYGHGNPGFSAGKTEFQWVAMDVAVWIGMGGLFIAAFARAAKKVNLIPTGDPRLGKSLSFENF